MDFIRYAERAASLVNADLADEAALHEHLADRSWLHRSVVAGDVASLQAFQADLRPVFEASGRRRRTARGEPAQRAARRSTR